MGESLYEWRESIIEQKDIKDYFKELELSEFTISFKDGGINSQSKKETIELSKDWYKPEDDIYGEM